VEFGSANSIDLPLAPATGEVTLLNADRDAEVLIDGNPQTALDPERTRFRLTPGRHTIQLRLREHDSAPPEAVNVPTGGNLRWDAAGKLTRKQHSVTVRRVPGDATVVIKRGNRDERVAGSIQLVSGRYEFAATAPNHDPAIVTIDVGEGLPNTVDIRLNPLRLAPAPARASAASTRNIGDCITGRRQPDRFIKVAGGTCGPFPGSFSFQARRARTLGVARAIDWSLQSGASRLTFKLDKDRIEVGGARFAVKADADTIAVRCKVEPRSVSCEIAGTAVTAGSPFDLAGSVLTVNRDELITAVSATVQEK
jgi:hypothetical protein